MDVFCDFADGSQSGVVLEAMACEKPVWHSGGITERNSLGGCTAICFLWNAFLSHSGHSICSAIRTGAYWSHGREQVIAHCRSTDGRRLPGSDRRLYDAKAVNSGKSGVKSAGTVDSGSGSGAGRRMKDEDE